MIKRVFKTGMQALWLQAQRTGQNTGKLIGLFTCVLIANTRQFDAAIVMPHGSTICSPVTRQCPAWRWLTGIPLPLSKHRQATGCEMISHLDHQLIGNFKLLCTQGCGIPLRRFDIIDRDKGGLTTHGQSHILFLEALINLRA